jgi:hypothetical protein
MKYQVLGHKRRLQSNDKPYDVICEFDSLIQLFAMMDKVDRRKYDGVLVIDTYTNELVASRELERSNKRILQKK